MSYNYRQKVIEKDEGEMIRPSFLALMHKFGQDAYLNCVEVGVASGDNAIDMLDFAPNIYLTLVDPYKSYNEELDQKVEDKVHKEMLLRMAPYKKRIHFIKETSEMASFKFENGLFDYVYIDGDHSPAEVHKDLSCWFPKVKQFGMLAGHDWWCGDVCSTLMEYLKDSPCILFTVSAYSNDNKGIPQKYAMFMDWWVNKETYGYK